MMSTSIFHGAQKLIHVYYSHGLDCRRYVALVAHGQRTEVKTDANSVFVRDLLKDPSLRNASDIAHEVVAVASSSSKDRAEKFIADTGISSPCTAYGDYESLVADKSVDVVYVATPHSHHYQNVMLALHAGKNVLCEKAFTVNAEQTKILCETARKNNLFLMEAVWTRYFPLSVQVRQSIQTGEIGEVLRVTADTSFGDDVEQKWGTAHRMVNPDLAGGALLDCKFAESKSVRMNRS